MKKIFSMFVVCVMIISLITINKNDTVNAEENWQMDAIVTPADGNLVGAGYVDVIFKGNLDNAVKYQIYLDGEKYLDKETGKEIMYTPKEDLSNIRGEVYTTKVSVHKIFIEATLNDESTVRSDERTFYVSKKGIAMGGDMSKTVELKKLNLSWYYNWATPAFNNNIDAGVAHVPMMWGIGEDSIEAIKTITEDSNYVLGFNEPDIASQANMTVEEGVDAWSYLYNTGKRTVSPASYDPNGTPAWVTEFLEGIEAKGMTCDSIALHCYGPRIDVSSVLNAVDKAWEKYHKPIWVTEISVVGRKSIPGMDHSYEKEGEVEKMMEYVKTLVEELDKRDYVERYAWFPYNIQSSNDIDGMDGCGATAMFDYESGKYTQLGFLYSQIGNPEGYNAEVLTDDDKYQDKIVEETTTGASNVETTTEKKNDSETTTNKQNPTTKKISKVVWKNIRNNKKKTVKLTWKKVNNASKYQIQYSLNSKFKKAKKYNTKTKTTSKLIITVNKLKKNKTYYFRVRGISNKMYGNWSKVKKIKIKK